MLGVLAGALAALALLGVAISLRTPLKSGDFAGVLLALGVVINRLTPLKSGVLAGELLALGVCMSRLIPLKPGEKFRKFNN